MGYTIAIAGKGGTGKTTIAALLVRIIKEKKLGSVLAVDADPNSNLGEVLGLLSKDTIGSILDDVGAHPENIPAGMTKDRFIEYRVETAVVESQGFDLLSMGRPEGPGCYCFVNNVLRNVLAKLINNYDYTVIDNEAGLEHLSRRTTRSADTLVVISDATKVGLVSARKINELADELKIKLKNRFLIINRYNEATDKKDIKEVGLEHLGNLPLDKRIMKLSLNGSSLMELDDSSLALEALRGIADKIWHKN